MKKSGSLIKLISRIFRASQGYIIPRVSQYGIGRGQWYFLNKLLFEKDGLSQQELSKEMVVDSAHTARAIKYLEESGYVARQKDPEDARKNKIYVTKKAVLIREDYHNLFKDLNKTLVQGFTKAEKELLMSMLDRMCENINKHLEEEALHL